jgi:hypothetical protein
VFDSNVLLPIWLEANGRLRDPKTFAKLDPDRWYLFTDRGARLHPNIADLLLRSAAERPEIDIFYGDEVVGGADPRGLQLCKPCFDSTQIIGQDYIGWPIIVRGRALIRLGGFEPSAGSAVTYDLILRAMSEGLGIERITEVLAVHRQPPPRSTTEDRAAALERWRQRSAPGCEVLPGFVEGTFQLRRRFTDPPEITLVIPTRQGCYDAATGKSASRLMILDLLESLSRTDWPMERLSVLIGDHVEDGSIYKNCKWPFRVERVVTTPPEGEPFNFAAKINRLWQMAKTEYLVLLNDDLVVRNPDWLRALMTFAVDEDVGGVGARLLYPNETIQHAGMPAGVLGPCTHAFIGRPAALRTYQNWAEVHREWSTVTGAVFAVRKDVLRKVQGFDQTFPLDFNDVDLCLRLRLFGYRIVYTPFAEFTHYEGASRQGMVSSGEQVALFFERWQDLLQDDPAYHPRLTRSSSDVIPVRSGNDWWLVPDNFTSAGKATWHAVKRLFARGSRKMIRLLKSAQVTIR